MEINQSLITILIIVAILIVLFSFIIGVMFFKMNERRKAEDLKNHEGNVKKIQQKQLELFFSNKVVTLFKDHEANYLNMDSSVKVADVNKEFTQRIKDLVKSPQLKSIIENKDSEFNEAAKFLKLIAKESPFVWRKKYAKEIDKYYG